jgi:hypothetical protein
MHVATKAIDSELTAALAHETGERPDLAAPRTVASGGTAATSSAASVVIVVLGGAP